MSADLIRVLKSGEEFSNRKNIRIYLHPSLVDFYDKLCGYIHANIYVEVIKNVISSKRLNYKRIFMNLAFMTYDDKLDIVVHIQSEFEWFAKLAKIIASVFSNALIPALEEMYLKDRQRSR